MTPRKYTVIVSSCCETDFIVHYDLEASIDYLECRKCHKPCGFTGIPCTADKDIAENFKRNLKTSWSAGLEISDAIQIIAQELNINLNDTTPKT